MPIRLTAVATMMPSASKATLASVSLPRSEWMPRLWWWRKIMRARIRRPGGS